MSPLDPALAYQSGRATFMGVDVAIAPGALVPREETELLGRTALGLIDLAGGTGVVIDMCCGSGNLACALAVQRPRLKVFASDLTEGAVGVASTNVARLGIAERVTVMRGDLFTPLAGLGLEGTVDMVVCNPPYISTGKLERERADLLAHEPREAFDGGPYGVSIFQRVIRDATAFLKPGGYLLFEIGVGQERQVMALFRRAPAYVEFDEQRDANQIPRVIIGRKSSS